MLLLFIKLMAATLPTIIIDPIICKPEAVSLNIVIPKIKVRTVDKICVIVTIDISAVLNTFNVKYQLNAIMKPFNANIKIYSIDIDTSNGIQIRLNKNAMVVNITRMVLGLLLLRDDFLKTSKKPFNNAYNNTNTISITVSISYLFVISNLESIKIENC